MIRLYSMFFLLDLVLVVVALIDCLSAEEFAIRALPRVVWVFLILLFSPVGPIVWFVAGRPLGTAARSSGGAWRPGSGFPESERPRRTTVAPDDDPEFLRGLAASRKEDEELLKSWEADLRRREDDLRRRESDRD
jgi:hypothetical protein